MTPPEDVHPDALPTVPEAIELRTAVMLTLQDQQKRLVRTVRRWVIASALVLLVFGSSTLYAVHLVRITQNQHSPIVVCQSEAVNGLLKDVPLAFAGDKNPADYSKIPKACGVSR